MKKLIVSVVAVAFAVAVQAGETKQVKDSKSDAPCCSSKATQTTKITNTTGKTACSGGACKDAPSKRVLLSPKAAAEVAAR